MTEIHHDYADEPDAGPDGELNAWRLRVAATAVLVRRSAEHDARTLELHAAVNELVAAHDHVVWMRWRVLLSSARLERAARMLARARDLTAHLDDPCIPDPPVA